MPRACAPRQEKPLQWEAHAQQWKLAPAHCSSRKPTQSNTDPAQPKKEKWRTANNIQSVDKAINKIKLEINNKIDKKNFKSNKYDIVLKFFSFVSSVLPSCLGVGWPHILSN